MLKKMIVLCVLFNVSNPLIGMEEIEEKNTALLAAAFEGDYKLCRQLIKAGADVNCSDKKGNTPLHVAENPSTIARICFFTPNIHQKNKSGETPLLYQLYEKQLSQNNELLSNRYNKIDMLLTFGANPNDTIEATGRTALHIAVSCSNKQKEIVNLLLQKGADPAACSRSGLLPVELLTRESRDIIDLFSPYGYMVFCESLTEDNKSNCLYELLTNNASYLKELVDNYHNGSMTKDLLLNLFVTLQEQEDLNQAQRQQSMAKISRLGIICRYPSYALLEDIFEVEAIAYAKQVLKTTIIGHHLLKIDHEQGRAAVLEEIKQSISIPHNNKDLFVSTPEENKEAFVYARKSYKFWCTKIKEQTMMYYVTTMIALETNFDDTN